MLLKLEILKFLKNNFVYLGLTLFQIAESFFISILTDFLGVTYREERKTWCWSSEKEEVPPCGDCHAMRAREKTRPPSEVVVLYQYCDRTVTFRPISYCLSYTVLYSLLNSMLR